MQAATLVGSRVPPSDPQRMILGQVARSTVLRCL